jgi:transcriptional regulator with XRE-family HTH domain
MVENVHAVLTAVGPRLRALRQERGTTLADLADATGISVSTLSRLESGKRRPTLELLLPLAQALEVALDDLVDAPPTGDPRVHLKPMKNGHGMTMIPLSRRTEGLQAFKTIIPAGRRTKPELKVHDGYEWLYVIDGNLRCIIGDRDLVLTGGEAAEFDTRLPHWFGSADGEPVEFLSLFGPQGERAHVRAAPRTRTAST